VNSLFRISTALLLAYFAFCPSYIGKASGPPPAPHLTNQQTPISVTSELVAIPVFVTDSSGHFVPGLFRDNFRVYENHRAQQITLFEQEDTPVSVGILVDHSSSMASKLPNVGNAVLGFAHNSNPDDQMFVVNFADQATVVPGGEQTFAGTPEELRRAVLSISADGRTALYDAIAVGLDRLKSAHWQKKALILISDGGDNASHLSLAQILKRTRSSQVTIYSVGLVDEEGEEEDPKILEQLCQDTGGVATFPRTEAAVLESTRAIARDLREQYILGFVPQNLPGEDTYHKIQVQVVASNLGKLHVRARPGYSGNAVSDGPVKRESSRNESSH